MDHRYGRCVDPDIWSFALAFYARPGVAPLCLRLQREGGTDVMLLIAYCYTLAWHDGPMATSELHPLRDHVAEWRSRAVLPLRALRIDLRQSVAGLSKDQREAFRDSLKQVELAAERLQARMIDDWFATRSPTGGGNFGEGLGVLAATARLTDADITMLHDAATT